MEKLFIEDKNIEILEGFDKIVGSNSFSGVNTAPVICGRGKDDKSPFQINEILSICLKKDIEIHFVRDGDGMSKKWRDLLNEYAKQKKVYLYQLEKHEIENYLLKPELIRRAIIEKYKNKENIPNISMIQEKIKIFLINTISLSKYHFEDNLEDSIYKTANLIGKAEYRNFLLAKEEACKLREEYEKITDFELLRSVGMGKETLRLLFCWLNSIGFNLSKNDILQVTSARDIPSEISNMLSKFKSNVSLDQTITKLQEPTNEDQVDFTMLKEANTEDSLQS